MRSGSDYAHGDWQEDGQRDMVTFCCTQSTSGLWCSSHECPMMRDCHPRFVAAKRAHSVCHLNVRRASSSLVMAPFSFGVPLTLWTGMGWGSGVVLSLCLQMNSGLTKFLVAPESRSADTDMVAREVRVVSLMARLRDQGDCLDST